MLKEEYRYIHVLETGAQSTMRFRLSIADAARSTDDVQREIMELISQHDCRKLVVDLSTTRYLPSNIIGILAVLSRRGIELHLVNASQDVCDVMQVMGLDRHIHINEIELNAAGTTGDNNSALPVATVEGYVIPCAACDAPQTIDKHLTGKTISCSRCTAPIHVDVKLLETATNVYCSCPGCEQQQRPEPEWLDSTISCEFCHKQFIVRKIR